MREIKFRVWTGLKMEYDITAGKFGTFYVNPGLKKDGLDEKDSASLSPFNTKYSENSPVMQYTGLKDKKGKEIYEGDIVSCDQAQGLNSKVIGIVHFGIDNRDSSGWCDPRIYLDTRKLQEHNGSEFCIFHKQPEIIGNIYENPDLLK